MLFSALTAPQPTIETQAACHPETRIKPAPPATLQRLQPAKSRQSKSGHHATVLFRERSAAAWRSLTTVFSLVKNVMVQTRPQAPLLSSHCDVRSWSVYKTWRNLVLEDRVKSYKYSPTVSSNPSNPPVRIIIHRFHYYGRPHFCCY